MVNNKLGRPDVSLFVPFTFSVTAISWCSRDLKQSPLPRCYRSTYKCTLPADDTPGGIGDEQPLFQISKTNPQSPFWTMSYYAYAGREQTQ